MLVQVIEIDLYNPNLTQVKQFVTQKSLLQVFYENFIQHECDNERDSQDFFSQLLEESITYDDYKKQSKKHTLVIDDEKVFTDNEESFYMIKKISL